MTTKRKIEERATQFVVRCGVAFPPVPVIKIVESEGIELVYSRSQGIESGFAMRDGSRRIIGVNNLEAPRRQRFTIAHELGHLDLHAERELTVDQSVRIYKRDEVSSMATNLEEIEANAFAAALLMPKDFIEEAMNGSLPATIGGRDQLISALARQFDVSIQAMGYRLVNLGMLSP
ncbi:ImmA/IrrE family metallo-endopeptidase [Pseudonocardia hydrocarbonoxydans]|uniref:ImmA/IrrE family metallo-endopeptidase n=1 Tax=Pseudonocardia hydrocarbonoxydans TaxID=76726 RepID=A0A4Y3WVY4_9PSEU|nr:ImmA/IrrE family metallo-endopeptidase [Pseudonocardia hydrocarbonoxydans]GEC22924.1 ImmA/IrrE family metallo-endopeptidase [Pseudonocardia hydrocarbonoxydans]